MSKTNSFLKFIKTISNSINSLLEKNLNKLNFNNLRNLTRSSKIILTIVALIVLSISYLLSPTFFDKNEIAKELKIQLNNKFNLNFRLSKDLSYNFLPRPHFKINKSALVNQQDEISNIKNLKIFVSFKNLFPLKKIEIKEVMIENANFDLNKKNYNFFIKLLNNNFSNNVLKIKNSNIFFKNEDKEVLFINKILDMKYFYDEKDFKNKVFTENEIFNIPYTIEIFNNEVSKEIYSKLNINILRLQSENQHYYGEDIKKGTINFIFNKLKSTANYKVGKNFFDFNYFDKQNDSKFIYNGRLNFKPFYSILSGNTEELNLSYLFDSPAIISELLKTEIFNNKNLNFKLNIRANKIFNFNSFINIFLNSKIEEGLIDVDDTIFEWKNFVKFNLSDSLIYIKNGELILDGKSQIDVINHEEIYKFLLTPKNYRKKINKIDLNYTYNFDQKVINLTNIKIDDKFEQDVNKIIKNISIKNDDLQNKIYFKKLLNDAIKVYVG